jgi:tetratricopeptide (TPR) repeat protein
MAYFQQAIEKDPHFVLAYVGMADAFSLLGTYGFLPPNDAFPKAKAAAHKALELDDSLPEVHTTLGYISSFYDCDWEAGDREFRKALEYNPNDALTHIWYALHMVTVGRSDEGVAEAERAQELDPVSSIINSLYGLIYVWARRYDEGAEHLKKTIEMDPTFLFSYVWLTNAYCMKALYEEAVEEIKKALAFDKDMAYALGHLGWVYGIMDKKNEASKVLNQLNELSKKKYVAPWTKMMVSIGLGDMDKIFEYCEESYSERDPAFIMTIKIGPWYDILRSDPRYTALMKKMGLEK